MGQHKHNPTAIAAKNGELPPKPPKPGKRERDARLRAEIYNELFKKNKALASTLMLIEMLADTPYRK